MTMLYQIVRGLLSSFYKTCGALLSEKLKGGENENCADSRHQSLTQNLSNLETFGIFYYVFLKGLQKSFLITVV